jgi:hypothetical protein
VQQQQQPPPGKVLPVGSRPAWLVQAVQGGSAALNKCQTKGLPDDLGQPQQVEFMLGCVSCDYQQVRLLWRPCSVCHTACFARPVGICLHWLVVVIRFLQSGESTVLHKQPKQLTGQVAPAVA